MNKIVKSYRELNWEWYQKRTDCKLFWVSVAVQQSNKNKSQKGQRIIRKTMGTIIIEIEKINRGAKFQIKNVCEYVLMKS